MFQFLIFLLLCTSIHTAPAGLRIPAWHEGRITLISTPELHKEFQVNFELGATFTQLENIKISVAAPPGMRLTKGAASQTLSSISASSFFTTTWTLIADSEIDGATLRILVDLDTPVENLKKELKEIYSREPTHQIDQLIKFVQGFKQRTQSQYSVPIFIFETEGLREANSLHFLEKLNLPGFAAPLISYALPTFTSEAESETILKLNQGAQFFEALRLKPEVRAKTTQKNPGMVRRMLENHSYLSYQLAFTYYTRNDFDSCEQILRNLTALLMTESDFSYDFFLAIQNLRAISWLAQGKSEKARNTLITSIRTAAESRVRHYLQYNLAVLYDKDKNMAQRDYYLIEALRLSPGFSLAKQLTRKSQSAQEE